MITFEYFLLSKSAITCSCALHSFVDSAHYSAVITWTFLCTMHDLQGCDDGVRERDILRWLQERVLT